MRTSAQYLHLEVAKLKHRDSVAATATALILYVLASFTASGQGSTVGTPTFGPAPGSYTGAQSVTIATSTPGATIRYKVDGNSTGWYSANWGFRRSVTVDHTKVAATLSNFPVLISVTDVSLRGTGVGGGVGKADGTDILLTSSDGITKLNHELESYNPTTGALTLWVQVPLLSASADTVVYLYYGNASAADQQSPAAVWESAYKGVWHLKE